MPSCVRSIHNYEAFIIHSIIELRMSGVRRHIIMYYEAYYDVVRLFS